MPSSRLSIARGDWKVGEEWSKKSQIELAAWNEHIEKESKEYLSIFHKKLLEILPKLETHLFPVN